MIKVTLELIWELIKVFIKLYIGVGLYYVFINNGFPSPNFLKMDLIFIEENYMNIVGVLFISVVSAYIALVFLQRLLHKKSKGEIVNRRALKYTGLRSINNKNK